MSLKTLRQGFRDGCVFQGFAAPGLFAPHGQYSPVEAGRFAHLQEAMTTIKATPRYDPKGHEAFREALAK
jgi:hypothetical protein